MTSSEGEITTSIEVVVQLEEFVDVGVAEVAPRKTEDVTTVIKWDIYSGIAQTRIRRILSSYLSVLVTEDVAISSFPYSIILEYNDLLTTS
jgi:hypothetical protein